MARIVDGNSVAAAVRGEVAAGIQGSGGLPPGLATILVGDDPASEVYVRTKRRLSQEVGIIDFHRRLAAEATQDEVAATIDELAADDAVSGILLQLPLPPHLDAATLIDRIPWSKDVDGLTTRSAGRLARGQEGLRPCTPSGIITLLDHYGVELVGSRVVVVGRSELVGRPVAALLLGRHATVTVAHSRTPDLASVTRDADVLIAAAGVPGLITTRHVKADSVVIDVGIHRTAGGLIGDVEFAAVAPIVSLITPVPGGVGPMTIAELLRNTLTASRLVRG